MGFRFKKSKQIAPGVRVNFNKKSTSVTFGGKGVHHTISSNGKKTTSAGIPGSGLYYTSSNGGGGGSRNNDDSISFASGSGNGGSSAPDPGNDNGNKNKKKSFKYLLYCAAIVAILSACTSHNLISAIICIPVFIYFWKHKELERRKYYLGITAFLFVACLVFLGPTYIEAISVNSDKSIVMDINSSKKISYSIDPEDADSDGLKIVSSDSGIVSPNLKNHSFTIKTKSKTGTATIYLKDDDADVTSKKIKVTVEDKKAIAEAKKKAEQEKKRKAEEAKKKEQARIAAEKKKAEEARQTTEQATTTEREEMVWVSNTGSKYHSNPNCSNMRNPIKETLSDAKSRGLSPCSKCY